MSPLILENNGSKTVAVVVDLRALYGSRVINLMYSSLGCGGTIDRKKSEL